MAFGWKKKNKKEGFLPVLESLAKPLLISAAGTAGGEILKGLGSKILGKRKRRSKRTRRRIKRLSYA